MTPLEKFVRNMNEYDCGFNIFSLYQEQAF
jgi:hypothetical protein